MQCRLPSSHYLSALSVLTAVLLFAAPYVFAQGYPPEEAAAKMTLPEGFRAELVAAEPMITQPVAMEFDDHGRLWVVQYQQYPNPEGLKRVKVDRWSRTTYDRIPDPPPRGPKGNDAITILEDTDHDGRADAHHNFVDGLNLCSGLAFGHGGVFVLQVPYLLFYPDRDQNDVPDGDPEVLLTGFGMEDAHSVANSLSWGPDGWLYGNQGSTVTAHIRGIEFQQGIWRYHPLTKEFELFTEGGGNMWGLDFDPTGHELSSTNFGPYLMLHGVQGAYYWKSFGKHGRLHNPHTYGYFEHVEHHNPEGGHVSVGGQLYQGDAYPEHYRGKYIAANLLSHNVYWHEVTRKGSTFETATGGKLLDSNDTWFAPSDLVLGPDGCLYVADWCDRRTAHPDPDAEWDRSNGRIYRIAYDGVKIPAPFDLRALDSNALVDLLDHPNVWYRRHARTLLAERRDGAAFDRLKEQIAETANPQRALESLWAAHVSGGLDAALAEALLHHANPDIRRWTIRVLGDAKEVTASQFTAMMDTAMREIDVHVRSQIASTAKRLPAPQGLELAARIAARDIDGGDPHVPLLLWWAVEAHAMEDPGLVLDRFHTPAMWDSKLAVEALLPRLMRRYAADGSAEGDRAATRMLESAPGDAAMETLLASLEQGLQDRGQRERGVEQGGLFEGVAATAAEETSAVEEKPVAEELVHTVNRLYASSPDEAVLLRLATRLGNAGAYEKTKALANDEALPPSDRVAVLQILGRFGKPDCIDQLFATLDAEDASVREAALDALRHFSDDAVGKRLLKAYPAADAAQQNQMRGVLLSKPNWAGLFLAAVDARAIDAASVPPNDLRGVAHFEDEALNALVEEHWGAISAGTPEEKLAEMRRMNNELNVKGGDPLRGKVLFEENCKKCHILFGEGNPVGPDLTQANRKDREYLLVSLVDPSSLVRKEYQQQLIETTDGEFLNGVLGESETGTIKLFNANGEATTISTGQIADMREAPVSLMPEGLLTAMTGDDVRALFAYIQQDAPAAQP
ncbi:MAG: HEAT repeat domain-containing protein [Candidatus Hydrogenedentes bacterium]|nr:HEAT repeat domain-containing protein [Candidatus Hydrogenedentota bacterium]